MHIQRKITGKLPCLEQKLLLTHCFKKPNSNYSVKKFSKNIIMICPSYLMYTQLTMFRKYICIYFPRYFIINFDALWLELNLYWWNYKVPLHSKEILWFTTLGDIFILILILTDIIIIIVVVVIPMWHSVLLSIAVLQIAQELMT